MSGWIKIHREIQDHWIYSDKRKFSRFEAWMDILMNVNFDNNKTFIKGKLYDIKRGQSILSMDSWAKRWNWDRSSVRRLFKLLQEDGMILIESDNITTTLTVCNYDSYQAKEPTKSHQTTIKRPSNGHQTTTLKEGEEIKEVKEVKYIVDVAAFLDWFNSQILFFKGSEGKFKTLNKTDINNLKQLKQLGYSPEEWHGAFKVMYNSEWVQQNKMCTPSHFLRNENFQKYVNQVDSTNNDKIKFAWNQ